MGFNSGFKGLIKHMDRFTFSVKHERKHARTHTHTHTIHHSSAFHKLKLK